MGKRFLAWYAAAATIAGVIGAAPAAQAQHLRLGIEVEPSSIDPHYHNFFGNKAFQPHVFEALVFSDDRIRLLPGLAVKWEAINDLTWVFHLRPGVKFHDGADFTAADVEFTYKRAPEVPRSPSSLSLYVKPIVKFEILDPLTIRLTTATPFPLLPNYLSSVPIISAKRPNVTTEEFNAGPGAIGTGPYKFVNWTTGEKIELVRNDSYWGAREPWERVTLRYINTAVSRLATLLSGEVDVIDNVPTTDVSKLRADRRFKVAETISINTIGFQFDHTDRVPPMATDNDGKPLAKNPLHDVRVRRALSMSVNRPAIVERIMDGHARASGQFMPEGFFGWSPNLAVPRFDPDGAKKLLAEAGYPNGFKLTIHCQNNRFINDERICQTVAQMFSRIGVETKAETMPHLVHVQRSSRREFSMFTYIWGIETGEPSIALTALLHTTDAARGRGTFNRSGYSNPAFDKALDEAVMIIDDAKREQALMRATEIAFNDLAMLPLHQQLLVLGGSAKYDFKPRTDGRLNAMHVRQAQ